jgi:hypothetical protein
MIPRKSSRGALTGCRDVHAGEQCRDRHHGAGDAPARQRSDGVAGDDPAAARGAQQQPPRETRIEVSRDGETREHAAESRRLQKHEDELERRVAGRVVEVRDLAIRESPPANAARKNSGKTIDGTRIAGLTRVLWIERQATARAT